jgi:hypothetical protein
MSTHRNQRVPKTVQMLDQPVTPRVLQAGEEDAGQPYLLMTGQDIRMSAGTKNGISIDETFGTTIQGPISLSEAPENISFCGGYWRLNPMVLTGVASSAATPVPMLVNAKPKLMEAKKGMSGVLGGLMGGGIKV